MDTGKDNLVPGLPRVEPVSISHVSSNLPPEMRRIIESIDIGVPDSFKQQAKKAAGFVQLLDRNLSLDDPDIRTFIQQLQGTIFVNNTRQRRDPRALPEWLQTDFLVKNNFGESTRKYEDKIPTNEDYSDWFKRWLEELGYPGKRAFAILDQTPPPCPLPRTCKAYLESISLARAQRANKLPGLVGNLRKADYPVYATKSNGSSLVLYFNRDVTEFPRAKAVFDDLSISYRGPGQDTYNVILDSNRVIKVERSGRSNDQGLGGILQANTYSPEVFLEKYLKICQQVGKNPAIPYQTSFVDFYSKVDLDPTEKEKYLEEARKIAGYPVVYSYIRPATSEGMRKLAKPLIP